MRASAGIRWSIVPSSVGMPTQLPARDGGRPGCLRWPRFAVRALSNSLPFARVNPSIEALRQYILTSGWHGNEGTAMANKVTIYQVAKAAGVSISTVSLALNSPGRVSQSTREKVLHAADSLGFVPKTEAVTRARRSLGRIGVIGPFTSYSSFGRRLNGILQITRTESLEVVVFDQESAATSQSPLLASLPLTGRLDGLIVMGLPLDDSIGERLTSLGLPTVLLEMANERFDSVHADDYTGGRLAAEHLLERGHISFAYIGEQQRTRLYVSPSERRLHGFRDVLAEHGIMLGDDDVRLTRHGAAAACQDARQLLSRPQPPTAIFTHDDTLAAGVLRAARQLARRVPDDLAVVGYDDGEVAEALDLTTIRQPLEESGRTAAQLLMQRIADPGAPTRTVNLRLTVVTRDTTR
ncbi:MAG: LacI family DNA-binding transcriptional regulator, partial [Kribbellaceae bacterium]